MIDGPLATNFPSLQRTSLNKARNNRINEQH